MTDCGYVNRMIEKYDNNFSYTQNENTAYSNLKSYIHDWFNATYLSGYGYYNNSSLSIDIQLSGSRAKSTAIKGKSDLDIFVSINDNNNSNTLKEYYDSLYNYLKAKNIQIRKQNVSVGLKYYGCDIDVTPAKKVNSSSYQRYNDHNLWSNKHQQRMLTNIQKHIDMVKNSGIRKEIMLLKIWRENHKLDFPSIYIEQVSIDALANHNSYNLADNFLFMLKYLAENILDKRVVDPSNCNNIISDSLNQAEKLSIKNQAISSRAEQYWKDILW